MAFQDIIYEKQDGIATIRAPSARPAALHRKRAGGSCAVLYPCNLISLTLRSEEPDDG